MSKIRLHASVTLDAYLWRWGYSSERWICTLEAAQIANDDFERFLNALIEDVQRGEDIAIPRLLETRKREYHEQLDTLIRGV